MAPNRQRDRGVCEHDTNTLVDLKRITFPAGDHKQRCVGKQALNYQPLTDNFGKWRRGESFLDMLDCFAMALSLEDRLFGCLLGQAVGDALGFPVEGRPPTVCAAYVDDVLRHRLAHSVSAESFASGQYTDDTQLARELVISYVDRQGFDPADYSKHIAALFIDGRTVGRGRITEAAARRLAQGIPWDEAGAPAPAVGNGSASRAGPVGVLYGNDAERRKQVAADQGRITHNDPRAVAGSVAIASAVTLAGQIIQFDRTHFIEALSEEVASTNMASLKP